jgi:hypothetical protein
VQKGLYVQSPTGAGHLFDSPKCKTKFRNGERQRPSGCLDRITERRKLVIRLRLVISLTSMVVPYHSTVGKLGEKLAEHFRGGLSAWSGLQRSQVE